jgi:hypothetical protein
MAASRGIRFCIMTPFASFRDVIDLWPTKAALVRDLTELGGAAKTAPVRYWYSHDAIPAQWFDPLLGAAKARGFDEITYRSLAALYKRPGPQIEEAI